VLSFLVGATNGQIWSGLNNFILIARLTNDKWFWPIESDSTQLSTRGRGVCLSTLLRDLNILHLGAPISLCAILFGRGNQRSDLIGLVHSLSEKRAGSIFDIGWGQNNEGIFSIKEAKRITLNLEPCIPAKY